MLDGNEGQLFASGQGATTAGPTTYDRSQPVFDLDLPAKRPSSSAPTARAG